MKEYIPASLIELNKYFSSKDMCEYLEKAEVRFGALPEIIFHSGIGLEEKEKSLKKLVRDAKNLKLRHLEKLCKKYLTYIEEAKRVISADGVFVIYWCEYSDSNQADSESVETIADSPEGLMTKIESDLKDFPDLFLSENCIYHYVEKYTKDENGQYKTKGSFIYIKGVLTYIDIDEQDVGFYDGMDLNLPVPFKAGDIIEIDNYPFSPKYKAIVMGVGDNSDCCSFQALYKNIDGEWDMGAVKHSMLKYFSVDCMQVSPLFSATTMGITAEADKLLLQIQEYIRKNFPDGDNDEVDSHAIMNAVKIDILESLREPSKSMNIRGCKMK